MKIRRTSTADRIKFGRLTTSLVMALITALLVSGCAGGSEGNTSGAAKGDVGEEATEAGVPQESGLIGATSAEGEPQQGGTLTAAVWAEARTLDPAKSSSDGVLGGMETFALFDALMRYDPETGEYEPWMAKSIEHSDDYGSWTLGLRKGVNFTDGTPLNAEAVVFSFERAKGGFYDALVSQIESMETPDDLTVVFHLKEPWSRFPFALTVGPGRVPSPTAVKKWGEKFGKHPVGAGPFSLERWAPGEEIVMGANESYWGEGPYLDTLRFVPLGGDQARLDALDAGGVQVVFLRNAGVIASARKQGYGGLVVIRNAGEMLAINNAEGRPGADLRIRKAIAYAVNVEQIGERAYDGKGLMQKEVMASASRWSTAAEATPYDPQKARELVQEAKADGFDGTITILSNSAPTRRDEALALQAQLNAVGFDATIDYLPSPSALYSKSVEGSYDLAFTGIAVPNAAPWPKLAAVLLSEGRLNRENYSNPDMEMALNVLHDAVSEQDKQQALNNLQKIWTDTVPMLSLAAIPEFVMWDNKNVHGVIPTALTSVFFSQAWLSD